MTGPASSSKKWDQRHAANAGPAQACTVLLENQHLLPTSGNSLDLACGKGGNAILLAQRGLHSHACDISPVALEQLVEQSSEQGLVVTTIEYDLEQDIPEKSRLPGGPYDVIVASQYLFRPLCPAIVAALKPGGLLLYQTFTANKLDNSGPSNPAFLLQSGELLTLFADLQLVYYREDARIGELDKGRRNLAYFIGRKPAK